MEILKYFSGTLFYIWLQSSQSRKGLRKEHVDFAVLVILSFVKGKSFNLWNIEDEYFFLSSVQCIGHKTLDQWTLSMAWFSSSCCLCFVMLMSPTLLCPRIIANSDRAPTQVSIVCCHDSLLLVVLHSHNSMRYNPSTVWWKRACNLLLHFFFRQLALCERRESKETERQSKNVKMFFSSFHCWRLKLVGPTGGEEDGERTALSYESSYLAQPS